MLSLHTSSNAHFLLKHTVHCSQVWSVPYFVASYPQ